MGWHLTLFRPQQHHVLRDLVVRAGNEVPSVIEGLVEHLPDRPVGSVLAPLSTETNPGPPIRKDLWMAKRVLFNRRIWNTVKLSYCTHIADAGQLEAPEQVVPCLAPLTREKQTDGERQRERDIEQRLTRLDQAWSAVRDIGTAMHPPLRRGIMQRLVSSRLVSSCYAPEADSLGRPTE